MHTCVCAFYFVPLQRFLGNILNFMHMKHKFLLLFAALCVSIAGWAGYDLSNTNFYFDNTRSNWEVNSSKSIYFYIHKSGGGKAYKMTQIPNTNLYYYHRGSSAWAGAESVAFLYVESTESEISTSTRSVSGIQQYTAYQTLDNSLDGYYCLGRIEEGASGNDAALHWDRKDSWSSKGADAFLAGILHREQIVHVRLSTDGSTYSGQGDWGNDVLCNIAADYWQMNSDTKTSTTAVHKEMTHSNQTATGVRSSVQTFVATAMDGYKITGWSTGTSGPTSSSATYNYTVTATATNLYAYVEQGRAITTVCADAKGTITAGSSFTYFTGDGTTITAAPVASYYEFDHWDVPSGITVASTTSASTTITSASNGGTITAYFHEVPRAISVVSENDAKGTVTPTSAISYTVGATPSIEATIVDDHYAFDYWEVPAGITVTDDHAATTTITAATNDGTITAHFKKVGVDLTITAAGYASYYGEENLVIPTGLKAEYVTNWNNTMLTWAELSTYIPAETGVILSGAPGTYRAAITTESEAADGNMLKGSLTNKTIDNSCKHYILSAEANGSNVGLYWPQGTTEGVGSFENKANKAYLELPGGASLAPRRYVFGQYNTPTGVESIQHSAISIQKIIRDGQLFIIRDGKTYNAQGVEIK